jgi:3-oxoacyl-[acyl-carrier protein] reductase
VIAMVTGGNRGIGRAIVEALVADNWTVAFTYRRNEQSAREIETSSKGRAIAFQLDLADRERPSAIADEIESKHGAIEALVNNAGFRRESLLAMTADADWDALHDINVGGAFRCCRAVLPKMMHRRSGSIVNVSSLSAVSGVAGQTAYASAKSALLGMTRALARETGRRGIRVNAVLPGFVATDMTSDLTEAAISALRARECLARGVTSADVANAVAFLLSGRAAAITGQALLVDAGASV